MNKLIGLTLAALAITLGTTGCMSRMVREGLGAATGASGKAVAFDSVADLADYKGMKVESITVAPGLFAPLEMRSLVSEEFLKAGSSYGLMPAGSPAITVTGEIIHYEEPGMVDTAMGPLAEVIVRTTLTDAQTGKVLAAGNLVGRSKATVSSSPSSLAEGAGEAMKKALKAGSLMKPQKSERK